MFARVFVMLSLVLGACFPDDEAEATSSLAAPPAGSAYYTVRPDLRLCMWPYCGGVFLRAVNLENTQCADGSLAIECYVARLNAAGVVQEQSLGDVRRLIVRGRIAQGVETDVPQFFELRVDGAWEAVMTTPSTEPVWRVSSHGGELTALRVNGPDPQPLRLGVLDLGALPMSPDQKTRAGKALAAGQLLVAGTIDAGSMPTLRASQVFVPLGATSLYNVNTAWRLEVQR
jgi:Domain of unknown function (DUF6748)